MKEQIAAAALATTALLTAGCNPEEAPKHSPSPGVEATTDSSEQPNPVDMRVAKNIGIITINAVGGDTNKLSASHSADVEQALETVDAATGHHFKFTTKKYKGVNVMLSPTDISTLRKADLPIQERIAIEQQVVEQGLDAAQLAGATYDGNDVMAVSLEVPEPADKAAAHAYGENGGFNQDDSLAGITAVSVNDASPNVTVHELAHALNESQPNKVMHSNTANCDAFLEVPGKSDKLPLTMDKKAAQTCSAIEYGDKSTVMGNVESEKLDNDPFNAFQLLQLESLGNEQVKAITGAGTYQVPLEKLASTDTNGTKMIRIDMPNGVPAPFIGADPSLKYAYCLELSSNGRASQTVKLMVAGFTKAGLPTGDTYAIPLNTGNGEDPGLPGGFTGQFFKDSRFGLSIAVAKTPVGEPLQIDVARQR